MALFFAVHRGFKRGVYSDYNAFQSQVAGYGPKQSWAVFHDPQHAAEFHTTGKCPPGVEPHSASDGNLPPKAALPTPDPSPALEAPVRLASQPPARPVRLTASQPARDTDTEPEDDPPPRRPVKSASITNALRRSASAGMKFPNIIDAPPAPAPAPAPTPAPQVPQLVPRPPPHGTYARCESCNGTGWNITPHTDPPARPATHVSIGVGPDRRTKRTSDAKRSVSDGIIPSHKRKDKRVHSQSNHAGPSTTT